MGIKGLRKLLEHNAPKSMKERNLDNYFRRIIAVDASISIYQFLTAMNPLQNDNGEETSHLVGMFCRTAKFLEAGIEPVYVFDGTPPDMKKQEIAKRNARREDAKKELLDLTGAVEDGDEDKGKDAEELRKRTVKVTSTHYNGCKRLLQLMGVPVIQAPSEAEAQCSHLCKDGKELNESLENSHNQLDTFTMDEWSLMVLEELKLIMDQFIDLCILCGCDYCGGIEGIEGQEALNLIRRHESIESILDNKDSSYQCPDNWLYKEARRLFKEPNVNLNVPAQQLQWTKHDKEGLIQFLVKENDFSEDRVNNTIKNIVRGRSKPLQRIDGIFMLKRKEASEKDTEAASNKKTKA